MNSLHLPHSSCASKFSTWSGFLAAFQVSILWSFCDIFTKVLNNYMEPLQIAFCRHFMLLLFVIPCLVFQKERIRDSLHMWKLLSFRAVLNCTDVICRIFALKYLSVGSVNAICNTMPVFAGIFAWIFLKERMAIREVILSVIAFGGVLLIAQPPFIFGQDTTDSEGLKMFGVVLALGESMTNALAAVVIRKLGHLKIHPFVVTTYYGGISSVIDAVLATAIGHWSYPPCLPERLIIVSFGPLIFFGQISLIYALKMEKTLTVTIVLLSSIPIAHFLEYLIFNMAPDWLSAIGSALILVAAFLLIYSKARRESMKYNRQNGHIDDIVADEKANSPRQNGLYDEVLTTESCVLKLRRETPV